MFNKVRVGIMGTGSIAQTMATTIQGMRGVTCYAVGSRSKESAEKFAAENKIKNAYGSYEELCQDPKVDFIYVATPHSAHYENVKLALMNDKAVLCEKALTLNEAQAKELFDLAQERNVFFSEAMWTRFIPLAGKLKEILASNIIGEVQMLTADLSFNISWKQRIQDPALGGGALLDIGVYGLTFASMILGDDITDISSMSVNNESGMDLQDVITLKYRSGQLAAITCSTLSCGSNKGMIFGQKGHIEVDIINNFESITVYDNAGSKIGFYKKEKQITGYEYEVKSVMNALKEGWKECPEMPHAQSLRIMNQMDFIRKQLGVVFPGEEDAACKQEVGSNEQEGATDIQGCDSSTEDDSVDQNVVSADNEGNYSDESL